MRTPSPRIPAMNGRATAEGAPKGAFFLLILLLLGTAPAQAQSPWTLLEEFRSALQRSGPTTAKFDQTYVPAGFSEGDTESGHLSLWLPDCLRWTYTDPSEKHFLVCQSEVYHWNEGEAGGRRYTIDPTREPGLDLLLVEVAELRSRYVAGAEDGPNGSKIIRLSTPPSSEGSYSATLHLDASLRNVTQFEYVDSEGNSTRFVLSGHQELRHTALFQPPRDIEWTTED